MKVPVPPAAETEAFPLFPPLQSGLVPVTVAVTAEGLDKVALPEMVHDLESVTVTV